MAKNLLGPNTPSSKSDTGSIPVPSVTPNMTPSAQWPYRLAPKAPGRGSLLPPNSPGRR